MKALMALLTVLLVACSGSDAEAPAERQRDETVFDPLTGTLDRAAGVEDTIFEADAERRRQIDEAQGL
ncbi:MAG: hypothetical protein PVH89_01855 [Gammaproteobacteria bacterium]|jgi:hypothetical protein